ncbi:MAG: hypothetical protein LBI81_03335, partial [Puniceicoccales bacterium]|nr:hypothetical protein [Puniceicoccales bacterium]
MSATSFRVVEDRRSSLGEETSISYTVPSPTSFEEKYGPAIEVDDSLKPHLMEFAREVNGGILLDQLAECMTQNGKKCCIVPFDSEFLKSSPGTSNEIFLTMMCDRATENGNHCSSEEIFGNFERRITAVLQSFETVNTSTSTLEHPDAASNGDDILWHVCNNRKMEEFPEYVVDVQMSGQENFAIRVFRWDGNSYDLKVDETVSPFQKLSDESIVDGYEVQQILQQIEESAVSANGEESISSSSNNVVSRGVRLIIPDFGDIVMSSEGNVALDGINTEKSVYLSSPTGVTISNSSIQQMEVVADYVNVACVGNNGTETSNIHTLHLRRREFSDNPTGSLLISDSAHLRVDEIFLEGSGGVINCGRLSISHTAALNGSGIFNLGIVDTDGTSDMVIFDKISYLQNEKNGIVRSNGQLIISSATVHNAGNMEAQALNMIVTGSLENYGTIHSRGACSITCCDSTYNCGIITSGGDLYVQTVRLDNDYGKIISRGSSKFNIRNRLDNHGNTILSHDVVESVECYTAIPSDRTWRRDVPPGSGVGTGKITVENMGDAYGCDPDNPSVITSYGPMIISIACGNFDNSFGEIYALSGINANASGGDIINENGRIFCNGRAAFSGKNFRNGHVRGNRVLTDASATREVDPEVVIGLTGYGKGMDLTPMLKKIGPNGIYPFVKKESVQIRNENLVSENATACCVDFAALKQKGISNVSISNVSIAAKSFCVPEHTESEIIKTYKTMASYGRASVELGQIYASEDVEISAEEEKYLGTITAGQNISIGKGREDISVLNGHDRYTLLAGGDVKIALSDISDRKYINVQAKSLQINTEHPITEIN